MVVVRPRPTITSGAIRRARRPWAFKLPAGKLASSGIPLPKVETMYRTLFEMATDSTLVRYEADEANSSCGEEEDAWQIRNSAVCSDSRMRLGSGSRHTGRDTKRNQNWGRLSI